MYQPQIVLASTSPYRRELLERLRIPFIPMAPDCDETPHPGEEPSHLSRRLARDKAVSLTDQFAEALIIGSDQVAELNGRAIGKPGGHEKATEQLEDASGKVVRFHTAVCVVDTRTMAMYEYIDLTQVQFRHLSESDIEGYLRIEKPYDCAGSFKSEGLGIALFRGIQNDDPSALMGLPLIWLSHALSGCGVELFETDQ